MINPNGDEYTEDDPLAASMRSGEERASEEQGRFRQAAGKVSHYAGDAWEPHQIPTQFWYPWQLGGQPAAERYRRRWWKAFHLTDLHQRPFGRSEAAAPGVNIVQGD